MRQLLGLFILFCAVQAPSLVFAYGWSQSQAGVIYCYPTRANGNISSNANPADWSYCHQYAIWGQDVDGNIRCFPTGDNGQIVSGVMSQDDAVCYVSFKIQKAQDGSKQCYPADSFDNIPEGLPSVDFSRCRPLPTPQAGGHHGLRPDNDQP